MTSDPNRSTLVCIGTYTRRETDLEDRAQALFLYWLDTSSGMLQLANVFSGTTNPSYMTFSADRRFVYVVNEVGEFLGQSGGGISAFSLDWETATLTFLNAQPTHGSAPCYVSLDATGRWAMVANYLGGNITLLPVMADGTLGESTVLVQHPGPGVGVDPERQTAPHAHCIVPDPTGRFALAADLGLDQIRIYRLDSGSGMLTPHATPAVLVKPGAGPRHLTFHPNKRHLYASNELDSTVSVFDYARPGHPAPIQVVSTLPAGFIGENTGADLHVSPSGKFLFASNRGHDSLAIFAIEATTGLLAEVGHISTLGKRPRNFAVDPTGNYLLVANQDSDNVVVFRIDTQTGNLVPTGHIVTVPQPVCVRVIQR